MTTARQFCAILAVLAGWMAPQSGRASGEPVLSCGAEKVVIFAGTTSPEGTHAVGWTLRPKAGRLVTSVDWSAWAEENPMALLAAYDWDPEGGDAPYEIVNGVVDLSRKEFLPLPSTWPDWPHKNRGYLDVAWGPWRAGRRCALIQNDSRFYTHNLWLVSVGPTGMRQRELVPALTKVVTRRLRRLRPASFGRHGIFFSLAGVGKSAGAVVRPSSATIPFRAEIPKSTGEIPVTGTVTITLPRGEVRRLSARQ